MNVLLIGVLIIKKLIIYYLIKIVRLVKDYLKAKKNYLMKIKN